MPLQPDIQAWPDDGTQPHDGTTHVLSSVKAEVVDGFQAALDPATIDVLSQGNAGPGDINVDANSGSVVGISGNDHNSSSSHNAWEINVDANSGDILGVPGIDSDSGEYRLFNRHWT